jgi:eukaryotic-like serine/threonine-protein kinase
MGSPFDPDGARTFCELLLASGLVAPDNLAALIQAYRSESPDLSVPPDVAFARFLVSQRAITEWQADKLLRGRFRGFFFGKYMLLDHVCVGEDSSTFVALDTVTNSRVLIEVWPPSSPGNPGATPKYRVREETEG